MSWLKDKGLKKLAKIKKELDSEVGISYMALGFIFSVTISLSDHET